MKFRNFTSVMLYEREVDDVIMLLELFESLSIFRIRFRFYLDMLVDENDEASNYSNKM